MTQQPARRLRGGRRRAPGRGTALDASLERALELGELELFYQPIADLAGEGVAGAEALVRWKHPDRGCVSPADFIPIAEQTGLIVPIGDWILRNACAEAWHWLDRGAPPATRVSVNVSAIQLASEGFVGRVEAALGRIGAAAGEPGPRDHRARARPVRGSGRHA